MKHGSLESGLGGFDYAAEMLGWTNVFHCEINGFCQNILKYYWPNAKSYTDIFEFDGTAWRGKVDIISAGFPCQPFSHAGKRKGSEDDRHIWPENMRVFREAKPRFIVAENVPGLLTIENGLVFEQVCADLETEGYETQAFIIPACAKDAVHRRDRVWIVAHNCGKAGEQEINRWQEFGQERKQIRNINNSGNCNDSNNNGIGHIHGQPEINTTEGRQHAFSEFEQCVTDVANSTKSGFQRNRQSEQPFGLLHAERGIINENWLEAATRLCGMDDELAGRLDTTTISKSKWRTESLKAYGNAIYWPIAYEIFKAIEQTK